MPAMISAIQQGGSDSNQTITKQVETVIATTPPLQQDGGGRAVFLLGSCQTAVDGSATTLKLRIRRTAVGGTLVGVAQGWVGTAGTMSGDQLNCIECDTPGEFDGNVYVLTILDIAAAANFVVASARLLMICI